MTTVSIDELDEKLLDYFKGFVVKKDLVREIKSGANVPVFVLEYLLANSCSTADEEEIQKGLQNVKSILQKNYVDPDQSEKVKADVKRRGSLKIIDRIEAYLDTSKDLFWATLMNSSIRNANIRESDVNEHEKMLMGGIWSIIELEYDPEIQVGSGRYPFVVNKLKPIQLSRFPSGKIKEARAKFTKDEWKRVLLRSVGLEPDAEAMDDRRRMLFLSRLIPLVEANFNMIELGPRNTGKSFTYEEFSPYASLQSGEPTVAQLFVNMSTKEIGLVGYWDAIAFDEAAGLDFNKANAKEIMKGYMASGSFSRGSGDLTGKASMVFIGNIEQNISTILSTSNLFSPLKENMQDTALLDRIHFYLPGWEIMKYKSKHFTSHFGMSMDFFSEYLHSLRNINYTDEINKYFDLGSHLNQRDETAARKTVSGFLKLLHPDGEFGKEDVREYLEIALEMRRRVKEQLKRLGGMEFWDTNFSYIDKENREEHYVNVPEEAGSSLIQSQPLKPGLVYTVSSATGDQSLLQLECTVTEGKGKISVTGTSSKKIKDDIKNTYKYLKANEQKFLPQNHSLNNYDVTIDIQPLIGTSVGADIGASAFMVILSAIHKKNLKPGLGVVGDISVGGGLGRVDNFAEVIAMLSENGAKHILAPMENVDDIGSIPRDVHAQTDTVFYDSAQNLLQKAIVET